MSNLKSTQFRLRENLVLSGARPPRTGHQYVSSSAVSIAGALVGIAIEAEYQQRLNAATYKISDNHDVKRDDVAPPDVAANDSDTATSATDDPPGERTGSPVPPKDADAFAEHVDDTDRGVPTNAIGSSTSLQLLMEFVQPLVGSATEFATGALAFVAAPDFESPADAGGNNVYDVTVQVSDGSNTDTQAIAVTVSDANDNAPVISSNGGGASAAVSVAENGTAVTTVTASDADAGATLSYSIVGGADAARFAINAATGALSFVSAPDFESPADAGGNNVYDVTVQVSDGSNTDTQAIAVTVSDANDNAPVISSNGGGASAAVSVAENGTAVTTVTASDADAGATLSYSIVGGADAARFAINAATGALSFVSAPDFESPADAGGNNVYDVTVQVSDGSNTDTQAIAVTVSDANDNAPVISSNGGGASAAVSVAENGTAVTTVTASDADAGATLSYSIVGGADAARFAINAATGALSFVSAPDFESPADAGGNNVYDVTVQVSDGSNTDTQAIAVTVTNVSGSYTGTSGNDTITGSSEEDTITGGAGADVLTGGLGADIFVIGTVAHLAAGETINGTTEAGTIDTLRLSAAGIYNLSTFTTVTNVDAIAFNVNAAGFNLTVADSQVSTADANGDGTQNDIQISASVAMTNGVTISGAGLTGSNRITVVGTNLGGADTITGGAGVDTIDGGAGADTITGGAGADVLTGGLGADIFVIGTVAHLAAGETINGTTEAGTIDTLRLSAAGTYNLSTFTTVTNVDAIAFNVNAAGFNLTVADSQVSTADANGDGTQNDIQISASVAMTNGVTISGAGLTGSNRITVVGTNLGGADTITGGAGADVLTGGAGADTINTGAANDNLQDIIRFGATAEFGDTVNNFDANGTDPQDDRIEFTGTLNTAYDDIGAGDDNFSFATDNNVDNDNQAVNLDTTTEALFIDGSNNEGVTNANLGNTTIVAAEFNAEFAITASVGQDALLVVNDTDSNSFAVWQYVEDGTTAEIQVSELALIGVFNANAAASTGNFDFF